MVILMGTFTSSVALRIFNTQIIVKNSTERHSFREGPVLASPLWRYLAIVTSLDFPAFDAVHYTLGHHALEVPVYAVYAAVPPLFLAVFCPISTSPSLSTALDFLGAHPCFWLSFCITWRQHETQVTIFIYSGSKPQRQTSIQGGDFKVTLRTCRGISEAELLQVYCSSICEAIKLKPSHWCEGRVSLTQEPTQRKRRWEGRGTGPQKHLLRPHWQSA